MPIRLTDDPLVWHIIADLNPELSAEDAEAAALEAQQLYPNSKVDRTRFMVNWHDRVRRPDVADVPELSWIMGHAPGAVVDLDHPVTDRGQVTWTVRLDNMRQATALKLAYGGAA